MRRIVVYHLLSLDGVAEDPDAFIPEWDAEMDANLGDVIATQDAVILGRRSYDEWSRFWPRSDIQPFSSFINGVEKHVATASPLGPPWAGARRIAGDLAGFARELKTRDGGDVGVHASITVAQTLLAAGVVDELRIVIAPRVAAAGRRLFDGIPPLRLQTVSNETSSTGYAMIRYRVLPAA